MRSDQTDSCSNCRYYRGFPPACRKRAPQMFPVATPQGIGMMRCNGPETEPEYWCGEWEAEPVRVIQ